MLLGRKLRLLLLYHNRVRLVWNTDLLDSFSAHIPQLVDAGNAADLVHLVQEDNTCAWKTNSTELAWMLISNVTSIKGTKLFLSF